MRKEYIKVSILIIIFLLFYSFFGTFNLNEYGKINNSQDFSFHFNTIKTKNFSNYPPLYHFLFSVIPLNELQFYLINLILICVVIPLLIFSITKKAYSVAVYFCLTSLPHTLIYGATYPHTLILIFFLLYLKNKKLFFPLLILATLTHKSGLMLFISIFLIELIILFYENFKLKMDSVFLSTGFLIGTKITGIKEIILILTNLIPLPLIYFSKTIKDNKLLLLISILSLITATLNDIRAISIMQTALILNFKMKKEIIKPMLILFSVLTIYYLINYGIATIKLIIFT